MNNYKTLLGENIKIIRIKQQLSQEKLAVLSSLHRTYVGAVERGERNISLNNIVKIANALKIRPFKLLQRQEDE